MPRRVPLPLLPLILASALLAGAAAWAQPSYVLFESGPVRPVALTPDGQKLLITNIPEGHLEIFDVGTHGELTPAGSVPVGLEPVAVAARTNTEVWVVNHLSDSVSIVDLSGVPRVVRTLLVGDEPRDIVFAGTTQRAFITTARRGQHRDHDSITTTTVVPGAGDPLLTAPPPVQPPRVPGDVGNPTGDGRADIWVFDAADPGTALGGVPESIVTFFADTPRALAVSPDDSTVYVAAFHSGNQSTAIGELDVPNGFAACTPGNPGLGAPGPDDNATGTTDGAPEVGVIVQWDGSDWVDGRGCTWNSDVPFTLPDHDVFALDADTLAQTDVFDQVGTILFNMVVNPVTGMLYVTNTESPNRTLFEGPGHHGGSTVQGHLSESRITVIDPSISPTPPIDAQHLNWHIDYDKLHTDIGDPDHATIDSYRPHSLATPLQAVVSSDGGTVYVAAFGSGKVGVIDATLLEGACFDQVNETSGSCNPADVFDPFVRSADYIATGGGPSGLALNGADDRLYVYERFDNTVSVFDVSGSSPVKIQTVLMPTAEPASVIEGRPFLYDAVATSGNGEASCASCHIFGDLDSLAWNLGDPDGEESANNQPSASPWLVALGYVGTTFHSMKGPMTTQTLKGLSTHGALHWRGDRLDGFFNDPNPDDCLGSSTIPSNAPCDETRSFDNFIVAFEGLIGRHADAGFSPIPEADMHQFTDFALDLMLPPNPVRRLDNTLESGSLEDLGEDVYFSCGPGATECRTPSEGPPDPDATDGIEDCDGCHDLDPAMGFFGSAGEQSFENEPQFFKVPHLRNMYAKLGMFSVAGDQIRGFGFLHDGSIDTLKSFFANSTAFPGLDASEEDQLEQLMLHFPSDLAPVVGQQASIGPGSPDSCDPTTPGSGCPDCNGGNTTCEDVKERVDLLVAQAGTCFESLLLGGTACPGAITECDLIAKTVEGGVQRGYQRLSSGLFQRDDGGGTISESALRNKAELGGAAQDINYTCVPPGSGRRMGIDRDLDSDPANDNNPVTNTLDANDNCPAWPNGPLLGTCTAGDAAKLGSSCTSNADCDPGGFCSKNQEDGDSNGVGDACEPVLLPEPGGALPLLLGAALLARLRRRRSIG